MTTILACSTVLLWWVFAWALCRCAAKADQGVDERERER